MSNLCGRNITSGTILVSSWKTYSTNSTSVSVINVQSILDYSLFNAYEFIYNQVPYYYVVDGSHNYWVNDLSSIGYKLYEEPSYEFILVDDTTGRVTHGVESLNQIEFSPTGYFLIESYNDVIFVVELPTVSTTGDWDDGNRLYPYGGGSSINTFFAVGEVKDATTDGSSTTTVPYNSENSYCIFDWFTKDAIGLSDVVLVNNNGNLAFSNVSDHTFNIRWFNVAVCSSNQASVITVYDSSNTAYNAFKYTIDNIDYYYVLDETQTAWTNDLSSIGYHLSVVLPTVEVRETWYQGDSNWVDANQSGTNESLSQNGYVNGYVANGTSVRVTTSYDTTKNYGVIQWQTTAGTTAGRIECAIINNNGTLAIKNVSSSTISLLSARIAVCSSNIVTVVTVYNLSNVAYNAFKYTYSGTDYYYVLDGTQTDWTDDLASIGYSLTPSVVLPTVNLLNYGWYNRGSSDAGGYVASGASFMLNDTSGNPLSYDTSVVYGVYMYYSARIGYGTLWAGFSASNDSNQIKLTNTSNTGVTVQRVLFATCSDSTATVVPVYDSSNVAYNAFKFTANSTDYYYVLDGTQADWTDDLASIGYSLYASEFDIDTSWGATVTIPSGYSVQSVKASRAYAVGIADEYSVNYIKFHITGEDVYCTDTDTSLLGCGVDPVIGLFQITTINSQGSYSGYHLTYRSSQTTAQAARGIEYPSLNSGGNFVQLTAVNNTDNVLYNSVRPAMVDGKPIIIRKYDSSGSIISYYLNVPQALWSFQNGVFSWLGDSTSQSDLAYFYYNLQVRIHCVRI